MNLSKSNKTVLKWLTIWCAFHCFALVMPYSGVEMFASEFGNKGFWPFTEIVHKSIQRDSHGIKYEGEISRKPAYGDYIEVTFFNGIFNGYDWTEFVIYVGGALFIFFFVVYFRNEKSNV
jgi:hypothetical protein